MLLKTFRRVLVFEYSLRYLPSTRVANYSDSTTCLGGAVAGRRTRDWKVANSTPGRGAIRSNMSIEPSTLRGR